MYPTLIVALIGAIPNYWEQYKALKYGTSRDSLIIAKDQQKYWENNADCVKTQLAHAVITPNKIDVEITPCPSGDILIRTKAPDKHSPSYHWFPLKKPNQE